MCVVFQLGLVISGYRLYIVSITLYVKIQILLMYGGLYIHQRSIHFSQKFRNAIQEDDFFTPKVLSQLLIVPQTISDHAAIFTQFDLNNSPSQPRYWRFNSLILKDHKLISYFTEEFKNFSSPSTDDPSLLQETSKAFTRCLMISYTASKTHRQAELRQNLESKLKIAKKDSQKFISNKAEENLSALFVARLHPNKRGRGQNRFAQQKCLNMEIKQVNTQPVVQRKRQIPVPLLQLQIVMAINTPTINETFGNFYEGLYASKL